MATDNQGPNILISTWLLTSFAFLFLSLRLFCKFIASRGLWWDDHVLVVSWLSLLGSQILITLNVRLGSGRHMWEIPVENLGPMGLQSNVLGTLSILAAVWSKTSFAITLLRLMKSRQMQILLWAIIASMNILMGLNAVFMWVRCSPAEKAWNPFIPGTCWDPNVYPNYGMFAAGYSAAMDFVLALLPWNIIWGLQMKRKEKIGVAVAMSMGIFAGATAVVKTVEIPSLKGGDFSYRSTGLTIWGTAESAVTIMAASIPVLRVLFRDLKSSTSRRYGSSGTDGSKNSRLTRSQNSTVTISAHPPRPNRERQGQAYDIPVPAVPSGIVQTNIVQVEFHDKDRKDSASGSSV